MNTEAGGTCETGLVDALDESAVDDNVDSMAERFGGIDISFNAIAHGDVRAWLRVLFRRERPPGEWLARRRCSGIPVLDAGVPTTPPGAGWWARSRKRGPQVRGTDLAEMAVADLMAPVVNGVRTNFITTRAAARHMIPARSGVVLMFGGTGDTFPKLGGLTVGLDAIEALRRQWTVELGPHGIRVVTLQTGGIAEAIPRDMPGAAEIVKSLADATVLGRCATRADVGEVAAFLASDKARTITGAAVNITCGAIMDYR